jgi:Holliday junction DNA helicase RuvB
MAIDISGDYSKKKITNAAFLQEDEGEAGLRPQTLAEYIGQEKAKGNLRVFIEAARRRREPPIMCFFYGPP